MVNVTQLMRNELADALEAYAEGVQENLEDDHGPGAFPIVEDYRADAMRIRTGHTPIHDATWEVLKDGTSAIELSDDPEMFALAVVRLENEQL